MSDCIKRIFTEHGHLLRPCKLILNISTLLIESFISAIYVEKDTLQKLKVSSILRTIWLGDLLVAYKGCGSHMVSLTDGYFTIL